MFIFPLLDFHRKDVLLIGKSILQMRRLKYLALIVFLQIKSDLQINIIF